MPATKSPGWTRTWMSTSGSFGTSPRRTARLKGATLSIEPPTRIRAASAPTLGFAPADGTPVIHCPNTSISSRTFTPNCHVSFLMRKESYEQTTFPAAPGTTSQRQSATGPKTCRAAQDVHGPEGTHQDRPQNRDLWPWRRGQIRTVQPAARSGHQAVVPGPGRWDRL